MNAPDIETTLRARAAFNASVEHLDDDTRRRLRAARLRALEPKASAHGHRWLWPAGAALAAALAIVVVLPRMTPAPITPQPIASSVTDAQTTMAPLGASTATASNGATSATSAHVIATATPAEPILEQPILATNAGHETLDASTVDTADPEMLDQLDFYGWLAQQPDSSHGGG